MCVIMCVQSNVRCRTCIYCNIVYSSVMVMCSVLCIHIYMHTYIYSHLHNVCLGGRVPFEGEGEDRTQVESSQPIVFPLPLRLLYQFNVVFYLSRVLLAILLLVYCV
jgi:hypothetical protein